MIEQFVIIALVLIGGWLLIVAPSQYIFPMIISKILSAKSPELRERLLSVSFFKFDERSELIDKLLKDSENSDYMNKSFSKTYKSYTWSKKLWLVVMSVIVVGTILSQIVGTFNFINDPKGQIRKAQETADKFSQSE